MPIVSRKNPSRTAIRYLVAALSCLALVISCGGPGGFPIMTLHPLVLVDETFTPEERAGINDALSAWEHDESNVHFRVLNIPHLSVPEDPNTIQLIRINSTDDRDCPFGPITGAAAQTHYRTTHSLICIDAFAMNNPRTPNDVRTNWRVVTMHEVGHAFFLRHTAPVAIMNPTNWYDVNTTLELTDIDRTEFNLHWGPGEFGPKPVL